MFGLQEPRSATSHALTLIITSAKLMQKRYLSVVFNIV
ncbi:hypothetical protein EMIT0215P_10527 [Pseudomonas serboccidentalis]